MTALVMVARFPSLPLWLIAPCLLALVFVFAPQEARTPRMRMVLCAVLLAMAFGATGHALVYYPYACQQDQSDWTWWLLCHLL